MTVDLKLTREEEVSDLNPVAGDLHVDGVDFALVRDVDAIVQEAEVELRWWLGEWFLDRRRGMPFIERILVKGASIPAVQAIYARALRRVPGVRHVERMSFAIDRATRRLTGSAVIRVDDGSRAGALATVEV